MIEAQGLTRKYGGAVAVDRLSFTVHPGQVTALVGPNGAGKSTALRLMLQLERGRGRTLFGGRRYRDLRHPVHEVGAWLGNRPSEPRRRARTELRVLAAAYRIKRARVDEVLDLVGLAPVAGVRVGALSAGALGRLGLAGALLGDPHTLVLDEPSAGQDPEGVRWMREFLRAYATQGRTVLVAGHGLTELADSADRVLALARGRLVADQSAADFRTRAEGPEVYVRTPQVDRLTDLLRSEGLLVHQHGGAVLTVTGADRARIGEIAFRGGVLIHELAQREASLADASCALAAAIRVATAERAARAARAEEEARAAKSRRVRGRAARRAVPAVAEPQADQYVGEKTQPFRITDPVEGVLPLSFGPVTTRNGGVVPDGAPAHTDPFVIEGALFTSATVPTPAPSPSTPAAHRRPKRRRWLSRQQPEAPEPTVETPGPARRTFADEVNA
ncbi:ABC transporter ATP-binding protein [Yinghuangia seranimata]|uniref:ABC transporter ATP-binding protein n=1 Tax=Yinghuangia seranimata TaxID=408067 RepID=UPI00248AC53E|nr:ATP-binding cassette domain-containing protein [Yinghuangia seranimata]MDI2128674.1 ATP-binding cassette domain-containing protein [Yinghuangia seranimata]